MPAKADDIRAYALEHHVRPWRQSGGKRLSIRAGDVVRSMRLRNATPNVCSALESRKFQREAGLVLVHREGPRRSTTTTFHYESSRTRPNPLGRLDAKPSPWSSGSEPRLVRPASDQGSKWRAADLCLVSCVSVKRAYPVQAKDLYTSPWYCKARACVEALGCPWYILSAKYGLVDPNTTIEPYEKTLNTMRKGERREWTSGVLEALDPILSDVKSVTILAGKAYREFLEPELHGRGITINVPMEGMGIGRQLSWLDGQLNS